MKKNVRLVALMMATVLMMSACNMFKKDGFQTTESGVRYRFEKENSGAQKVQPGDVLVGEYTLYFDSVQLFSNVGHADRMMQAVPTFDGDLYEGLLLMHIGDKAVFEVSADTMARFLQRDQMPEIYKPNTGQMVRYEISLQDIVTKDEIDDERSNYMAEMQKRQKDEPDAIAAYVSENGISVKPTDDGLYVVVKKKGNGPKVAAGKTVAINYTGRLLDGTMFDSSVETDARRGNIYDGRRTYEPLTYTVGQMALIPGWEKGVMGQAEGSVLQLIIPSNLGYGPQGAGNIILPYSPLVFDIEIVSVK